MRKVLIGVVVFLVLIAPAAQASAVTLAATFAAKPNASCGLGETGPVPNSLTATAADGVKIRLDRTQLTHAATILKVGGRTPGVGRDGVLVALMAALTESSLRMLANTSAWPQSARFPNDGNGGDHDSLGLFQMRPLAGWGTVTELMNATYQARAFFGGEGGPNRGSPRGLRDIPGWRGLPKGAAAQAVEVSAFPDRYARFEPVAEQILDALTVRTDGGTGSPEVPETGKVVFPLPARSWTATSPFGMRTDPVTGAHTLHTGSDYAAPNGTPILAAADGVVAFAGDVTSGYGHLILIKHTVNAATVYSGYAHVYAAGIHVRKGQRVTAGQHIADVGTDGKSTGPHLHFEIRPGSPYASPIDAQHWLTKHGATRRSASASKEFFESC
ncbi:M23 family metallopeptidase [Nocardioides sp. NPDC127503]|uniref:M23 family metallopeptidase n=1 Tax=Nocardioides sp. NPDC127503 TaxID=3154516 RepID=UPI003330B4E5